MNRVIAILLFVVSPLLLAGCEVTASIDQKGNITASYQDDNGEPVEISQDVIQANVETVVFEQMVYVCFTGETKYDGVIKLSLPGVFARAQNLDYELINDNTISFNAGDVEKGSCVFSGNNRKAWDGSFVSGEKPVKESLSPEVVVDVVAEPSGGVSPSAARFLGFGALSVALIVGGYLFVIRRSRPEDDQFSSWK